MFKRILLFLLFVLIAIQFIHPARNISTTTQPYNIAKAYNIPPDVKTILDKACMDCHSNNTRYPWYSKIQPVDWWLTYHINGGKKHLNFDEYTNKPIRVQFKHLEEAANEVDHGDMPLNSYTWIHKDAKLTETEKTTFINWTEQIRNEIKSKYPADSLKRPAQPTTKPD
jgi:hypothetical protein